MKATRETIIPAKVEMRKGATVKEVTSSRGDVTIA